MKKHAIIYVFGLGDHRARGQTVAVGLWRSYGVYAEVFHMYWRTSRSFVNKIDELLARIDNLTEKGYVVSLVGTSAGASVAIAAYAARPQSVHAVVCACGKLRHPETISAATYGQNPLFRESMAQLASNLEKLNTYQRGRILSIRPVTDHLVPPADTLIPGAHNKRLFTAGHAFTIAWFITVYTPFFLRFIKSLGGKS